MNFALGHVEAADLYEVRDNKGRRHAVMVPDVCGNVSVLAETADADDSAGDAGAGDGTVRSRLPDELIYRDSGQQAGPRNASVQQVPEPGTLACVLAGLALAAGLARRRIRVQARRVGTGCTCCKSGTTWSGTEAPKSCSRSKASWSRT